MPTASEILARAQAHEAAGQWAEAEGHFLQLLASHPDNAELLSALGAVCGRQGKLVAAETYLQRAVALKPTLADAHNNLAALAVCRNRFDEAVACWRRTVALKPGYAEAHNNLGAALDHLQQLDDALVSIGRAIELKPDFAEAHQNLGAVLQKQQRCAEAAAAFRRALALNADLFDSRQGLAVVLSRLGNYVEALPHHQRAIELRPAHPEAHSSLGGTLLSLGRLAEGWPQYEWRWKLPGMVERHTQYPRWDGAPLAGRTILLHCEQAHGDSLQFIRYAALVKQTGARVIVESPASLARLLARSPGVDEVVVAGSPLPHFDVQLPLLSLPGVLQTTLETIPATVPYLRPAAEAVEFWRKEFAPERRLKVGIAWQGNPTQARDRARSFHVSQFAVIAALEGLQLYSLQMGIGREQLAESSPPLAIIDLGDRLGDFDHTAAIVRNLDLVITCDSAPAHLAGGLGTNVWVALPFAADWRWLVERSDSPWYPTMRLFRQPTAGDWSSVFRNIQAALPETLRARGAAS